MARRLGVTQGYLSKVEHGLAYPDDIKPWMGRYQTKTQKFFRECWMQGWTLPLWQFAVREAPAPVETIDCRAPQKEREA